MSVSEIMQAIMKEAWDKPQKITDVQIIMDNMHGGFLVQVSRGIKRKSYQNPNPFWASRLMELVHKPTSDLINICKQSGFKLKYISNLSELGCGYEIKRGRDIVAMGYGNNRIQAAKMILDNWEKVGQPENALCVDCEIFKGSTFLYGRFICSECYNSSYWR